MDNETKPTAAAAASDTSATAGPNGSAAPAAAGDAAAIETAAASISPTGVTAQAGPVAKEGPDDPPPPGAARPVEGATIQPPFTPEAATAGTVEASGETKEKPPAPPEKVLSPPIPSATPPMLDPENDKTPVAQEAVDDDILKVASAAQILDPAIPTASALDNSDQRATAQNLEAKMGPTAAELAEAAHSQRSPPADDPLLGIRVTAEEVEDSIPHPTLPHVFASAGRMYNEALALGQSLEVHVHALQLEGQAEMHAVAQRLQILLGDYKTGIENIEAAMSPAARAAIEQLHKF